MKSISLDSNTLSEEEIADRLEYDTKKRPKPNELRIITQLLTEIKSVHEDEINELNYQTIQTVFQITFPLNANFNSVPKDQRYKL